MIPSKLLPFSLIISLLVLVAGCSSSSSPSSLLPAALGGSSGPFEGIIKMQTTSAYGNGELIYTIKGHMAHLNTGPGTFAIADFKAGTSTGFMPATKTYMVVNFKDIASGLNSMTKNSKVVSTGKTETIAGVKCDYYIVEGPFKSEMCIAKNFIANGDMSLFFKDVALPDDLKNGGFPLKTESEIAGKKSTMLVTSIERKSIDDSVFAFPAGYKKMEMPKIPGMNQ